MALDLGAIEGLSDEQKTAILSAHDVDVTGLKGKNTQLMDEAKSAKTNFKAGEDALEDARKAAVAAEEKRLIAEGKYDEALKLGETERASLIATADAATEKAITALNNYHKGNAINDVLSHVDDRFKNMVKAQLENSITITHDEQGQAKTVFKNGNDEFSSASDFINGVGDDETWKSVLKGADSSGAGTKQSNNNGDASSSGIDKTSAALAQRLKQKGLIA